MGWGSRTGIQVSIYTAYRIRANDVSATNSWLGYASCFGLGLAYGGGVTTVFGLIIAGFVQWIVFLGLAELSSALPSSGVDLSFLNLLSLTDSLGSISLYLYPCTTPIQKLRSIYRGNLQYRDMVGYNSIWDVPDCGFGFWDCKVLVSTVCQCTVAGVSLLCSCYHPNLCVSSSNFLPSIS